MRNVPLSLAALAALSAILAGCATGLPHYPTRAGYAAGPAPLSGTLAKPKYATEAAAAPATPPPAAQTVAADAETPPPASSTPPPVGAVERQDLPPPDTAQANPAAAAAQSAATSSNAVAQDASPPPAAPAADTSAVTSAAAAPPPAEPPLAPRTVLHDEALTPSASGPPAHEAAAPARERRRREPESAFGAASNTRKVVAASGVFENYEVKKGDHVDALARAFDTSRKVLLSANDDLKPPYRLRPGQVLKVPVAKAYIAERGDTLGGIAKRFGVEQGELADLNHISTRASLRSGQEIGLPSSMHDRGPLRTAAAAPRDYADETTPPPDHAAPAERAGYLSTKAPPPRGGVISDAASSQSGGTDLATPLPVSHQGITPITPSYRTPEPIRPPPSSGYHSVPPGGTVAQAAGTLSESQVAAASRGRFIWPLRGEFIARFGPMGVGRRNDGVDIKASQGSAVVAAAAGEVAYAGDQVPGYGNLVLIKHADGWVTAYAHLDKVEVHMKDQVVQGQEVGQVGMTGDATQPALHFEVRYAPAPGAKTQPVDPVLVLPAG